MDKQRIRSRLAALISGAVALVLTGWAIADPPVRVARLGYISGAVSFSPAGEDEWVQGVINRPLITGDRLWVAPGARAELQIGVAVVRIGGGTSATLLNLDDRVAQLELAQGKLNIRVRRLAPNQVFEIDTPNLAFSLRRAGDYRVEVDPAGDATLVLVRSGLADVYSEGAAYAVGARQAYRYYGTGLLDYENIGQPPVDEFDRWSTDRDSRALKSVSLRYVSPDVIGYEDLDANGTWRTVAGYGNVWVPSRVGAGWAPYRDGHWAWVEPWGWTWIDDAPWGFAVSHYGRWANLSGTWGWVPGPIRQQAIYAPALVGFVGGSNFRLSISSGNVGGVAWFPLGPRDVYRPSYAVSRDYFTRVNSSNTVISTTNITNVYNNNSTNITYVNQRVPGAVVAVPATTFVQSQQVSRAAVRLNAEQIVSAPVSAVAAVAPVHGSVIGAAARVGKPAVNRVERPVVARTAPPPPPVAFTAREVALAATPGKPLAPAEIQSLKPGVSPVPAPQVVVAVPVKPAVPMTSAKPSKPAPGAAARGEGAAAGQRGRNEQAAPAAEPSAKPQPAPQPPAAAPAPESRVPPAQRGRVEPAPQPAAPTSKPQPVPPASSRPAPQAPVIVPQDSRVPPGQQRGRAEPAPQPAAPAPTVAPSDSRTPQGQSGRTERPAQAPEATMKPQPASQPPVAAPPDQRPSPGQRGRTEPQAMPVPQPPAAQPAAKPQPASQIVSPAPVAAPAEQRPPPVPRGRTEPPQPPAPPVVKAQPAPAAPAPPAAAPMPEQRTPPIQRGQPEPQARPAAPAPVPAARPPEQRPAPQPPAQAQPGPNAPPAAGAEQRGKAAKPAASGPEDKRGPEQIKQEDQQRQDEEKKGRKPN